ncbi:hypothetical protein B0H66DRAFT_346761 [Apodospora peruviana]|uniref:Amidohydrolase-related domain-containing protein n=1 Tax=Apodospora peruviana TaxID=516989 RepID=A0AAE0HZ87_9PEZI|nr:hypothetical protein B0H66DRAFT_346761 [Apodospora peruviana]
MDNIITLEEHFISDACNHEAADNPLYQGQLLNELRDLGPVRLQHMDAGKVAVQVISHVPANFSPSTSRAANDELASAVSKNKQRFAGFAALAMSDPAEAASELRRCVQVLKFAGALIDAHTADGTYCDGPEYDVFWQAAQDLNVPIYLHPTYPAESVSKSLYLGDNISPFASLALGAFGWGWHSDTALAVLRMFAAGVFDRFPRLKIVIGHMGEMIPFMFDRIANQAGRWNSSNKRTFREVWDANVWITTSGVWSVDPLACILRNTRIERIMYSVDYPFSSSEKGLGFLEDLRGSGLVDEAQFRRIVSENAVELLGWRDRVE